MRWRIEALGQMADQAWSHESWWRLFWLGLCVLILWFTFGQPNAPAVILGITLLIADVANSWRDAVIKDQQEMLDHAISLLLRERARA